MKQDTNGRMARLMWLAGAVMLGVVWANSNLEAQTQKGIDALNAGNYERAIAVFKAAAQGKHEADLFVNFYWLGRAYYGNGQLPEAIAAYEESLKHRDKVREWDPSDFALGVYQSLGNAYRDNKQYPSWTLSKVKCCRYRHLQRLKKCSDTPTLRVGIRRPVLTGAPAAGRRRRLGRPSRRSAWPGSAQCSGAPRA